MICRKCNIEKPEDGFHIRRESGRRRTECIACRSIDRKEWMKAHPDVHKRAKRAFYERYKPIQRERSKEWNRKNPDKRLDTHLRRSFKISLVEYTEMLKAQHGTCAICLRPETAVDKRTGKLRRLHVDHNHETGVVRKLLCTRCNMAIGYLGDSPDRADAVAAYIRQHSNGGKGTADMVARAKRAGVQVIEVPA